jgi:hypothetical protein
MLSVLSTGTRAGKLAHRRVGELTRRPVRFCVAAQAKEDHYAVGVRFRTGGQLRELERG